VLTNVRIEGDAALLPRLKVYALLAPHLDGGGAGNSAHAVDLRDTRRCWRGRTSGRWPWDQRWLFQGELRICGSSDGWRDLMDNFRMDWEFGSATNGNIAVMGEVNLDAQRALGKIEFTVGVGIGRTSHGGAKDDGALATPFEENRSRFITQWKRAANPAWLAAKASDGGKLMGTATTCSWRTRTRHIRARLWLRCRFRGAR